MAAGGYRLGLKTFYQHFGLRTVEINYKETRTVL